MREEKIHNYFFFGLLALAGILAFLIFRFYIAPVVFALALAVGFRPVYRLLLKIFSGNAVFSAIVATILAFFVVVIPLTFFSFKVFQEGTQLYLATRDSAQTPEFSGPLGGFLSENFPALAGISVDSRDLLRQGLDWLVGNINLFFSGLAKTIFSFFLSMIALYYFLKDGHKLRSRLMELIPLKSRYSEEIMKDFLKAINSIVKGALIVALVQGILAGLGYLVFGVPQPALLSAATMIAALIPLFGTSLVAVPASIYLFAIGNIYQGIGLFLWSMLIVGTIDNVLRPKLIERGVNIHPFLILLSVLGGVQFFGPVGFLAGPLVLSFLFTLIRIYPRAMGNVEIEDAK